MPLGARDAKFVNEPLDGCDLLKDCFDVMRKL